jgi:hypothetical protein
MSFNINPRSRPKKLLPVLSLFLIACKPQNVKNIVTSIPEAAAPVAIIKAAISLSISPLKTTIESLLFSISFLRNLF